MYQASRKSDIGDYEAGVWYGLFAPGHTPKTAVAQISRWFTDALQAQEIKQRLIGLGLFPDVKCGADFAAFLRKQYEDYGVAIHQTNVKVD